MSGILLPVYVDGVSTRKDKSVKISLVTQELSPEKVGELFHLQGKLSVAYLSEKEASQEEIDKVDSTDPEFESQKTQSQRIRNILHVLWKQRNEGHKTFNGYYHTKTEMFIEHLKSKIE